MRLRPFYNALILVLIVFSATNCTKTTEVVEPTVTLNTYNNKPVGSSAKEILSADKPTLVFEINYMKGYPLESTALDYVKDFLSTYTSKTSYQIVQKEIPVSGKDSLSLTDIDALEKKYRTTFSSAGQTSVYIMVTDGRYNPANTLGFAYRNTSITLFGKAIRSFSGGVNQVAKWKLEANTLEHEFGHLMGLVNVGSPMKVAHEDGAHPAHCNNASCLMYYQTETTNYLGRLMSGGIASLDANCHADLIANGGK